MLGLMNREDIYHLATLARLRLTDQEISQLESELSSIVSYVSTVSEIAADDMKDKPETGVKFNVFRQDEVTNQPEEFTKAILAEMPTIKGRYMSVKKILKNVK